MVKKLVKFCVKFTSSVEKAIMKIENNKDGFILIINENNILKGVATSVDIRRFLLNGGIKKRLNQ